MGEMMNAPFVLEHSADAEQGAVALSFVLAVVMLASFVAGLLYLREDYEGVRPWAVAALVLAPVGLVIAFAGCSWASASTQATRPS